MKRAPSEDPDDSFSVEITSLDTPEKQEASPDVILQGARLAPRVRNWLTVLSVVGGILLVLVVFLPFWSSLLPKKAIIPPKPSLPLARIENVIMQDDIAYITSSDDTLRALRLKNGSLLWKHKSVNITPVIINNTLYTGYSNQKNNIIQALRMSDGAIVWTYKASLSANPVIIDNGGAYSLDSFSTQQSHILIALDSKKGAELWQYPVHTQSQIVNIEGIQDKIYVMAFPDAHVSDTELFVLNIHTGLPLWHVKAQYVQKMQNNVVSVVTTDGMLKVLRSDDGHEIWQYKSTSGSSLSSLSGANLFYIQTPRGLLQALSIDTGRLKWTYSDPWGVAEVFPETNGVLYLETGDGFIVALRARDGKRLWHVRPVPPPFTFGSVQVINGIVYTFTTIADAADETVAALNVQDGTLLWRYKISTYSNSYMSPQVINDLFLADSGNAIIVLRTHNGMLLWHMNYTPSVSQYNPGLLTFTNDMLIIRSSDNVLEAHQLATGGLLWRYLL